MPGNDLMLLFDKNACKFLENASEVTVSSKESISSYINYTFKKYINAKLWLYNGNENMPISFLIKFIQGFQQYAFFTIKYNLKEKRKIPYLPHEFTQHKDRTS